MARPHALSSRGLRGRRALHRFLYAQLALRNGLMVALGREQPLVRFTVEADPPSVYVVHPLRDPDAFADHLALPAGMELAPIRCLVGDRPRFLLTLNVYRVSGITNGIRAEWSTYVADPDGVVRYLVVDARADTTSMDPVDVITRRSTVAHRRRGEEITFEVGAPGHDYRARFTVPRDAASACTHPEWTTANDVIYWRNGVCDRTFYDAGLAAADVVEVDPASVRLTDRTAWADFVEPVPSRILVFRDQIEFVVSPWANLGSLEH